MKFLFNNQEVDFNDILSGKYEYLPNQKYEENCCHVRETDSNREKMYYSLFYRLSGYFNCDKEFVTIILLLSQDFPNIRCNQKTCIINKETITFNLTKKEEYKKSPDIIGYGGDKIETIGEETLIYYTDKKDIKPIVLTYGVDQTNVVVSILIKDYKFYYDNYFRFMSFRVNYFNFPTGNYINTIQSKLVKLNKEMYSKEYWISCYRKNLQQKIEEKEKIEAKIKLITPFFNTNIRRNQFPSLLSLSIHRDYVKFLTKDIFISPYTVFGNIDIEILPDVFKYQRYAGKFFVKTDYMLNNIIFRNEVFTFNGFSSNSQHPHVFMSNLQACIGNLKQNFKETEIPLLVNRIIIFLRSANHSDSAGVLYTYLPISEDGHTILLGYDCKIKNKTNKQVAREYLSFINFSDEYLETVQWEISKDKKHYELYGKFSIEGLPSFNIPLYITYEECYEYSNDEICQNCILDNCPYFPRKIVEEEEENENIIEEQATETNTTQTEEQVDDRPF